MNVDLALFQMNNITSIKGIEQMDYHSHNTIEITYMTSGTLDFACINKDHIEEFTLLRNQICIMMPNVKHRVFINNPLSSIGCEFSSKDGSDLKTIISKSDYYSSFNLSSKFNLNKPFLILNGTDELHKILLDLYKYSDKLSLTKVDEGKLELKIKEFALEIINCETTGEIKKSNIILNKALEFIENNYFRNISAPDVAKFISISYSYLKIIFKQETGMSIKKAINQRRVEQSKLLIHKGLSFERISIEVGFGTPQYFATAFKNETGISPSEYKKGIEVNKKARYFVVNNPNLYNFSVRKIDQD